MKFGFVYYLTLTIAIFWAIADMFSYADLSQYVTHACVIFLTVRALGKDELLV